MKISADGFCEDAVALPNPHSSTFTDDVDLNGWGIYYNIGDLSLLQCGHLCVGGIRNCCQCGENAAPCPLGLKRKKLAKKF